MTAKGCLALRVLLLGCLASAAPKTAARPVPRAPQVTAEPAIAMTIRYFEADEQADAIRDVTLAEKGSFALAEADLPPAARGRTGFWRLYAKASLDIAPGGTVRNCVLENASIDADSSNAGLDLAGSEQALCAILRNRARFRSAIDPAGAPLPGKGTVLFTIVQVVPVAGAPNGLPPAPVVVPPPPPVFPAGQTVSGAPDWVPESALYMNFGKIEFQPVGMARRVKPKDLGTAPLEAGLLLDIPSGVGPLTCAVAKPSGNAAFDREACLAVQAAGHRNWSGDPLKGYPVRVRWDGQQAAFDLPRTPTGVQFTGYGPIEVPPALADRAQRGGQVTVRVAIDVAGRIERCQVVNSSLDDQLDVAACALVRGASGYRPGQDLFGTPLAGTMRLTADWGARFLAPAVGR